MPGNNCQVMDPSKGSGILFEVQEQVCACSAAQGPHGQPASRVSVQIAESSCRWWQVFGIRSRGQGQVKSVNVRE